MGSRRGVAGSRIALHRASRLRSALGGGRPDQPQTERHNARRRQPVFHCDHTGDNSFAMTAGAASVPALVWNPMTASIVTRVNSGGMARPPAIRPLTKPAATAGTTPRLSRRTRKMAFARSSRRRSVRTLRRVRRRPRLAFAPGASTAPRHRGDHPADESIRCPIIGPVPCRAGAHSGGFEQSVTSGNSLAARRVSRVRSCRATRPATPTSQLPTDPGFRNRSARQARTMNTAWKASSARSWPTSREHTRYTTGPCLRTSSPNATSSRRAQELVEQLRIARGRTDRGGGEKLENGGWHRTSCHPRSVLVQGGAANISV